MNSRTVRAMIELRRHRGTTVLRRASISLTAALAVPLVFGASPGRAQTLASMAALGDSLTVALRACAPNGPCPAQSWATGSDPAVDSHALRLGRLHPGFEAQNFAVSARKVADLNSGNAQAKKAVAAGVDYVAILIGTNDVCRESVAAMTAVSTFRGQFTQALTTLTNGLPNARIFVSSIPDPERLRELFRGNAAARAVWAQDGTCAVFLQDPESDAAEPSARREQAQARLSQFNRELAEACAQHPACIFDGYAVTNWDFGPEHITTDYFHFSTRGQAALAALTYPLSFPAPSGPGAPLPDAPVAPPSDEATPIAVPSGGATPVAPPSGDAAPVTPVSVDAARLPAKLKIRSARVRAGRLEALLSITGRATGTLRFEYFSAGVRKTFSIPLGAARVGEKNIKVQRSLVAAQRRSATGILTVDFAGGKRVHGDVLRSRAANRRSLLTRTALSFDRGRLRLAGTVAPEVSGVVRLRVIYAGADGIPREWRQNSKIASGRWTADVQLPAQAGSDPHAYLTTQFTGDQLARGGPHRGEQDGKSLGNLAAG